MNYSQLINKNYEYNNHNSHRYLDELEWIKVAIFSQAINELKYTMIKKKQNCINIYSFDNQNIKKTK